MRCTCSNEQLHFVGCDCEAEVNLAQSELNRRADAEAERMAQAEAEIAAQQDLADAAMAAEYEAFIREQAGFDEDAYTHAQAELWVDMMISGEGA